MKNMKKLIALLLALVMVVGIMAGCTGNEDTTPSDEGTKGTQGTEGTQAATDTTGAAVEDGPKFGGHANLLHRGGGNFFDTLKITSGWGMHMTTLVFDTAITKDDKGELCPGICDFEISEDMLTVKMWVREGATFSNGDAVDIYDVEASFNRPMAIYKKFIDEVIPYVESIAVDEDGKTLTIQFNKYNEMAYDYLFGTNPRTAIMPKELIEEKLMTTEQYIDSVELCIGTGPYKLVDLNKGVSYTLQKREDYVPLDNGDATGFAATKVGYLDSITFYVNGDDASIGMAVLSGEYDAVEVMPTDYATMAEGAGLKTETLYSGTGCQMYFNTYGSNNICAKYPSLRKAVMAAVDYEEFLKVVTDNQQIMNGQPVLNSDYDLDVFAGADYYGPANLEAAAKYIEAAKAEGWNGTDAVQMVGHQAGVATLLKDYLGKAGIPFNFTSMESTAGSDFKKDAENNWDVDFQWTTYQLTPTLLGTDVLDTYWNNEEKDALVEKMRLEMVTGSDEYMAAWEELADMWVEDCATPYMGKISWYWFMDKDLNSNETGNPAQRYWFNAYWNNPEEHQG